VSLGIASGARGERAAAWALLESHIDRDALHRLSQQITLDDAIPAASRILAGAVRGRLVVDVANRRQS
jgi:acrylyl-CoA reductase (NADPH)